jgi:hypothetical protein
VTLENGSILANIGSDGSGKAFAGCSKLTTFGVAVPGDSTKPTKGVIEIPSVASFNIQPGSFEDCTSITTLKINGVAAGSYVNSAFKGCTSLNTIEVTGTIGGAYNFDTSVPIPSVKEVIWDITTIPVATVDFSGLTGLEKLTVKQTLATAAVDAASFTTNASFADLVLLENQTFNGAFAGLTTVKNVTIGPKYTGANNDSLTAINIQATTGTTPMFNAAVKNITIIGPIANTFDALGTNAAAAGDLTDLNLYFKSVYNNVGTTDKTITGGIAGFGNEIKTVRIGKGINAGANTFTSTNLTAYIVDPDNDFYANYNGDNILYSKKDGAIDTLVKYPRAKEGKVYAVPLGVKVIGDSAIVSSIMEEITIPESVIRIENAAISLTNHKKLRYEAVSATTVTAFNNTLTEVTFGEKVVSIPAPFFMDPVAGIEKIDIPESVTNILAAANFSKLTGLKEVNFRATNLTSSDLFYDSVNGMPLLRTVKIGENVKVIQNGTFRGTGVDYVDLKNVTTVGNDAFRGCNNLYGLEIPVTNTGIGTNAFNGCGNLGYVIIYQYGVSIDATSFVVGDIATATVKALYENPDPAIGGPGKYVWDSTTGSTKWYRSPN